MAHKITRLIIAAMLIIGIAAFSLSESEVTMPYIPRVKVGNTIYKIKDEEAAIRHNVFQKLLLGQNLFTAEQNTIRHGYYNTQNELVVDSRFGQTDFIEVDPTHYYISRDKRTLVLFYDENHNLLGSIASTEYKIQQAVHPPADTKYARFMITYQNGDETDFWVVDLSIEPNLSSEGNYTIPINSLDFAVSKNLFNINADNIRGGYYNLQNELVQNSEFGQTDYINVDETHIYTSRDKLTFVLFYNINKEYIGYCDSRDYLSSVKPAQGTKYIRFIIMYANGPIEDFYVRDVTAKKTYIPKEYLDDQYTQIARSNLEAYNTAQFDNKTWVSFGDSIVYRNNWQPKIAELLNLVHINCGIGSTSLSGPNVHDNPSLPSFWKDERLAAVKNANPDLVTILGGANDIANITDGRIEIGDATEFVRAMPANPTASENATNYSSSSNYALGTYCKKDGALYECTTAINNGEAWNGAHWKAVKNVDTFIGAYSYIIEHLLEWKKNLSIVILGTTWAHGDGKEVSNVATYTDFSEASRMVAQYYGLPFVDLHGKAGFNKFTMGDGVYAVYSSDHIHPNEEGAKIITKLVLDVLVNEVTVH